MAPVRIQKSSYMGLRKTKLKYVSHFFRYLWGILFTFSSLIALDSGKAVTQFKLETWGVDRGLEQESVVSICQTRDGYIWLATLDGLVRFDGIRFTTFKKEDTRELKNNLIKTLLEDRQGNLWIGTLGEGLYYRKDGKFHTYSPAGFPDLKGVYSIFQDSTGTLWIGTENNGLVRLKDGDWALFRTGDGPASDKIHAFYEDENNRLWIGTSNGISIYDPNEGHPEFIDFKGKYDRRFNEQILSICGTKNGELWLGCADGLYRVKNDNTLDHFGRDLPNPDITCLCEDSNHNLWAGTDGSGLIRIRNGMIETFPTGHILASGYIYAIYEDREKNLWIGSSDEGLHRLSDTLFTPFTTMEGLSHNGVNCVYEDREGSLWIGTRKGVNQLLSNGRCALKWTEKDGLFSNDIKAILEDNNGTLWIGTDSGLNRFKNGKLERIDSIDTLRSSEIVQLGKDQNGVIWILTPKHLFRFHEGIFTQVIEKEEDPNSRYFCLSIDRKGNPWIGISRGGGLYKLENGKPTRFTTREGLAYNAVECIYEDNEGVLYIGTRGGLSVLENGKFTNFTTRDGLDDDYIYFMLEDGMGYLWLAGRTGISRIKKRELFDFNKGKVEKVEPALFDESDGLITPFCFNGIKSRGGKLWFTTDKGLMMIDPVTIEKNTEPIPVVLEEVVVDGETVLSGGGHRYYSEDNPRPISPGKKRLEFFYTGLSFTKPRQIKFKVKLEGYDDWREVGDSRDTAYTGLLPGKYTFRVKACNSDGIWNKNDTTFSFHLEPYFSQTFWFYLLVGLGVVLTGLSGYWLRVRQLKARQKELTLLVHERTREVEHKNRQLEEQSEKLKEMDKIKSRFFANISHEFRTPLTLILGPLEQMIDACPEYEDETKRKLTLMLRNGQRLLRLINQLLELSKLDSGKLKLQVDKTNISSFLKGITASFQLLARQKELDLFFVPGPETEEVLLYIDPRKMEDIMSNLLINALKFTPPGGKITIVLNKNFSGGPVEIVEISVSDTGPGIPVDQLPYIFDRFYQADSTYEYHQKGSGIGLALTKELVELHHGTIDIMSRQGEGSTFTIRIPMGEAHLLPGERDAHAAPQNHIPIDDVSSEITGAIDSCNHSTNGTNGGPVMPNGSPGIILVVEDSADMREYIKGALEPAYTVEEARDGKEGIEKALELIPDLIVSDIMMPGTDGYELCRVLKNDVRTSHVPIIMLTAKASEESILQGLETGADDYITKPFNTKILSARIRNLIDIRSQLQANINREMTLQPVKTAVSSIDREFLEELHKTINKNLSDDEFNVEQLCKKLYMSRTTLYRKILAVTGLTPTDYIRSYRLKRAAQLLKQNHGSVLEVAVEAGFSNSSYFAKCFKEKFHQLPSEYQEANRK